MESCVEMQVWRDFTRCVKDSASEPLTIDASGTGLLPGADSRLFSSVGREDEFVVAALIGASISPISVGQSSRVSGNLPNAMRIEFQI